MGLTEFISKNNNERPDPTEWEKGKELMGTLVASGAVQLFEQLRQSILANPILRQGSENKIRLDKTLIVANVAAAKTLVKTDRENPIKEIAIGEIEKNSYIEDRNRVLPTAFLIFRYNFWTVGTKGTPFKKPRYDYHGISNVIILGCSNPEEIGGMSTRMFSYQDYPKDYPSHATKLKTQELKIPGRMDKFLGELYAKTPARSTSGEIEWY
ncbi:MAG: hypothetical protein Q7R31_02140 [Candidatus Levybacteria bacterium]|nr:hypothetical protein [Candidatus Levybacteria bacterium]